MAGVEFIVSDSQIADLRRILNPKQVQKALQVAVIRTTNAALRIASKAVRERTTIPQKYIADKKNRYAAMTSKISGYKDNPVGHVIIRDQPIPLAAFKHIDTKKNGVVIDFGSIDTPLTLKHAFVRRMQSKRQEQLGTSHLAVLTRSKVDASKAARYLQSGSGSKLAASKLGQITPKGYAWRLPIQSHFGPTVLDYITAEEIQTEINTKIGNELEKQVDSQVSRFTRGEHSTLAGAVAALDLAGPMESESNNNG